MNTEQPKMRGLTKEEAEARERMLQANSEIVKEQHLRTGSREESKGLRVK